MEEHVIRPVELRDAEAIAAIYNHYILNTVITFEEEEITAHDIALRIQNVGSCNFPWLVAEDNGTIIGYTYATKWGTRSAFRYSVEIGIYLSPTSVANGWGTLLYKALFSALREKSIHLAIAGITLPNQASIALHEKFGMKQVAHFSEVGFKFDRWLDVGYWQIAL